MELDSQFVINMTKWVSLEKDHYSTFTVNDATRQSYQNFCCAPTEVLDTVLCILMNRECPDQNLHLALRL